MGAARPRHRGEVRPRPVDDPALRPQHVAASSGLPRGHPRGPVRPAAQRVSRQHVRGLRGGCGRLRRRPARGDPRRRRRGRGARRHRQDVPAAGRDRAPADPDVRDVRRPDLAARRDPRVRAASTGRRGLRARHRRDRGASRRRRGPVAGRAEQPDRDAQSRARRSSGSSMLARRSPEAGRSSSWTRPTPSSIPTRSSGSAHRYPGAHRRAHVVQGLRAPGRPYRLRRRRAADDRAARAAAAGRAASRRSRPRSPLRRFGGPRSCARTSRRSSRSAGASATALADAGLPPYPSVTNFLLCRIGSVEEAEDATEHLLRSGIVLPHVRAGQPAPRPPSLHGAHARTRTRSSSRRSPPGSTGGGDERAAPCRRA